MEQEIKSAQAGMSVPKDLQLSPYSQAWKKRCMHIVPNKVPWVSLPLRRPKIGVKPLPQHQKIPSHLGMYHLMQHQELQPYRPRGRRRCFFL